MMDREAYRAEKARLKQVRKEAGEKLCMMRHHGAPGNYAKQVQKYQKARDDLDAFIKEHGEPNLFGDETRAERRKAKLRRKGITPVWEVEDV